MKYYNFDDIAFQESKLKVRFKHRIQNIGQALGYNDRSIPASRRVDVPLFLVSFLLKNGHCNLAEKLVDDNLSNDLKAKACLVNLNEISNYFLLLIADIGQKEEAMDLFNDRISDFSILLLKETFGEDDLWKMDATEKRLIVEARRELQKFRRFFISGCLD